ncbi:MAG: type II secretion system protein [Candidatus Shapirobacteria bacterium]|nr:type II secretion system protein [Candidatus Shapirobacteria bacterium]MDD3002801.1 type II secretion system protein [Candidatus Shapirobacteria bacterium]MDD4383529.1 type II secretion system protein [Candidatus Shapirobacteria bacterium]
MNKGMTLIEIIIYVAILSLVSTAFITISINMMSLKTKSISQQEIGSSLRFISQKINYEIRNAKSISSTTPSSLTLILSDSSRNPTVFDLNNGNIRMGFGSGGDCPTTNPCILNNNLINISDFTITNLSSGDSRTQNIEYTISGNYINDSGRQEFNAFDSITDSVEVRSR